jgi:hypothetical protein
MLIAIDPGTYPLSMVFRPDESLPKDFRIRLAGTLTMGIGGPAFAPGEGSDIPQCIGAGEARRRDNCLAGHRNYRPVEVVSQTAVG